MVSPNPLADPGLGRTERAVVRHIGLGFLLFLVVLPLTLASYNSYMSEDVINVSQKVAAIITFGLWCVLCFHLLKGMLKTAKFPLAIRHFLAVPLVSFFAAMASGFVILLAIYLVGDAVVLATADEPNRLNAKIDKVFKTRGCGAKVSFYVPVTRREATYCGDHFEAKPEVGDSLVVDQMISPYGTSIMKVRLAKTAQRK